MNDTTPSLLAAGTAFEGKISFSGTVRIDGTFRGSAQADGILIVGEQGAMEANLLVRGAVIRGAFRGDVVAKERIEIGPTARVEGSLRAPRITIAEGAWVQASVEMGETLGDRSANPAPR